VDLRHDVDDYDDFNEDAVSDYLRPDRLNLAGYSQQVDEAKIFKQKVYGLAKFHIQGFFNDKFLHTGGKIPKSVMFQEKRIHKVINYSIIDGVEKCYDAIGDCLPEEEDIRLVIDALHKIGNYRLEDGCRIPIEFRGGLLCLYLELVEGYRF